MARGKKRSGGKPRKHGQTMTHAEIQAAVTADVAQNVRSPNRAEPRAGDWRQRICPRRC